MWKYLPGLVSIAWFPLQIFQQSLLGISSKAFSSHHFLVQTPRYDVSVLRLIPSKTLLSEGFAIKTEVQAGKC